MSLSAVEAGTTPGDPGGEPEGEPFAADLGGNAADSNDSEASAADLPPLAVLFAELVIAFELAEKDADEGDCSELLGAAVALEGLVGWLLHKHEDDPCRVAVLDAVNEALADGRLKLIRR